VSEVKKPLKNWKFFGFFKIQFSRSGEKIIKIWGFCCFYAICFILEELETIKNGKFLAFIKF